jgi:hypothetical protein
MRRQRSAATSHLRYQEILLPSLCPKRVLSWQNQEVQTRNRGVCLAFAPRNGTSMPVTFAKVLPTAATTAVSSPPTLLSRGHGIA